MTLQKIDATSPLAQSANLVAGHIAQLKALFPELLTEGPMGTSVNVDVLKALVGDATASDADEKYGLNWHGKRRARQLALTPSTGTLRPCVDESVDWDSTQNLMIEGDNLEVLKLLQKSYAAKVKLIYIDPPYNTGKDFVYPDNFQDNIKNYLELTGQVDGGQKISSNTDTSGRFHTDWLNMMYPRLKLARNLLREDGVIFLSIDEAEVSNLKNLCIDIFGEENFIASIIWEKGRKNDAKLISIGHEYMLVFAKDKSYLAEKKTKWREAKPGAQEILDEYLKLRKVIGSSNTSVELGIREFYDNLSKNHPAKKHSRYNKVDDNGVWRDDNMSWPGSGGPTYDVIHPITQKICAVPQGGWRYGSIEKMQEMILLGKVVFREDHSEPPIKKTYLVEIETKEEDDLDSEITGEEDEDLPIQVAGSYFYRSGIQASNELNNLFEAKVFNNPKDSEVISRWLSYCGVTGDDIVMDFFAGSGTTAHSVLNLNLSKKISARYILVQLPEIINSKIKGTKPALNFLAKLGKPRTIAELTKERLRRAAIKIRAGLAQPAASTAQIGLKLSDEPAATPPDLGFRVFKLAHSNIRAWNPNDPNIAQAVLDNTEHLMEGRTEADIVFELLLKRGLDLCAPMASRTIAGKTVGAVDGGKLMTCLADRLRTDEVEALALGLAAWHKELAPEGDTTCFFRDSAFENDVAKANLSAILTQYGITTVRSL